MIKYVAPRAYAPSFTCPNCGVLSQQVWTSTLFDLYHRRPHNEDNPLRAAICQHCSEPNIWVNETMCFPDVSNAPFPNPEMPEAVYRLYNEAASVSSKSPRGAAALLRLSIQVLCKELGESGENVNTDIGSLVRKGLPNIVQQSLDIVRVTGNDAVHPGQIDTDNPETVGQLFDLVNIIVEYMIALPNKVSGIYQNLPSAKVQGIEVRDK